MRTGLRADCPRNPGRKRQGRLLALFRISQTHVQPAGKSSGGAPVLPIAWQGRHCLWRIPQPERHSEEQPRRPRAPCGPPDISRRTCDMRGRNPHPVWRWQRRAGDQPTPQVGRSPVRAGTTTTADRAAHTLFRLVPLKPGGKTLALLKNGVLGAGRHPDQVRRWSRISQNANLGLANGDGIVVDVCPRDRGTVSPDSPAVRKGSGGSAVRYAQGPERECSRWTRWSTSTTEGCPAVSGRPSSRERGAA